MKIIYLLIFLSKIIENALSTLRLIVVSNGKKLLGAILQLLVNLVWIIVTGVVIVDIRKDPLKILFFIIGAFVGSYIGSLIEEKMALGSNMLLVIIDKKYENTIIDQIKKNNYPVTSVNTNDLNKVILVITTPRKKRRKLVKLINFFDHSALIIAQSTQLIEQNYLDTSSK